MDEVNVIIRAFEPKQDEAYIYSSWRNSAYYSALNRPEGDATEFFKEQTQKIKNILDHAHVKVACLEDALYLIVGYSVSTGSHLDWIFVKPDYRLKNIGALLMPKNIETVTDQITKIGAVLKAKKNLKFIGEENGESNPSSGQADQGIQGASPNEISVN